MVFLLVFWSPKQVKTEESYKEYWEKLRIHLPRVNSDCKEKKQRESAMKLILDDSRSSHFWSTFWSPIYALYMSFWILGSQKSNASNSVQFGVEIKELQPLEADHSKLKEDFARLRNQPLAVEFLLKLPHICDRHFEIFYFRYLMSKSPNSPCNPPIIGFLSL